MALRSFVYQLDAQDRILFVNEHWLSFAKENGSLELTQEAVLHQSVWNFVSNKEVRQLYEMLFERVRAKGPSITFPYRCDSPGIRRYLKMKISALAGGHLDFTSWILREETRDPVAALDRSRARSQTFLTVCSWCKRAKLAEKRWAEVEEAIGYLKLFDPPEPPQLTHGICPECKTLLLETVR